MAGRSGPSPDGASAHAAGTASGEPHGALGDRAFAGMLPTIAWTVAGLYAFFALVDALTLPSPANGTVAAADAAVAVLVAAAAFGLRATARARWEPRAQALGSAIALLAVANGAVALWAHPTLGEATTFLVVPLAVGVFLLSWRWALTVAGANVLGAAAAGALAPPRIGAEDWLQFLWALTATTVLGLIAHALRMRDHRRMERLRRADQARAETIGRAHSLLAATLDSTADGLLVVDGDGAVASFNRRFLDLWRIPPALAEAGDDARLLGFVVDQLEDPAGFLAKVRDLYASPEAESFDVLRFKDGRVFERVSKPQRLHGRVVGRVWSFRDVTGRVVAEREAAEARDRQAEVERLREMDRFKTRFLSTVSHELNTPLTPLKLQLHLLREGRHGDLGAAQQRALLVVDRNVERLALLVQDMLDVARLQNGKLRMTPRPVDLGAAVAEAVLTFAEPARRESLGLSARGPRGLWVHADPQRLQQVLHNLLSNALKYSSAGGSVVVETARDGDMALVRVHDRGVGLTEEQMRALFQPFTQVHDTSGQSRPGTGLGLFISKGIVEEHGGRIWVDSRGPGRGSTFGFGLPRRAAPESEGTAARADPSPPTPEARPVEAEGA